MEPEPTVLDSLRKAVDAMPDDVPLRLHLAGLLLGAGQRDEAVRQLGAVLQRDPGNAQALGLLRGQGSQVLQGPASGEPAEPAPGSPGTGPAPQYDWSQAEDELRDVLPAMFVGEPPAESASALAPNEPDVHFLSGKVSLARRDLADAREHQERALALDPTHSGAMNELGRIRLRRRDTAGAIRHFISAARATPDEHIYRRYIDVVILRTVSRTIYVFTLLALILIWIPAVARLDRLPFAIGLGVLGALTAGSLGWMMLRLPREARLVAHRILRVPRVAAALALAAGGVAAAFALAAGGVAAAFGLIAFTPAVDVAQVLPIAVVVTVAVRLGAFAALRAAARER